VLAAILVLAWFSRRRNSGQRVPALPARLPQAEGPDRGMTDPLLRQLYMLLYEITQVSPEVTAPEHLRRCPATARRSQLLSDPQVPGELLLGLVQGERLHPGARGTGRAVPRPRDEALEPLLWAQLNRFHPWNGDGVLRVLEAWHPDDRDARGRVLVRLDRSGRARATRSRSSASCAGARRARRSRSKAWSCRRPTGSSSCSRRCSPSRTRRSSSRSSPRSGARSRRARAWSRAPACRRSTWTASAT
jgi:hypothetical protein